MLLTGARGPFHFWVGAASCLDSLETPWGGNWKQELKNQDSKAVLTHAGSSLASAKGAAAYKLCRIDNPDFIQPHDSNYAKIRFLASYPVERAGPTVVGIHVDKGGEKTLVLCWNSCISPAHVPCGPILH